MNIFSEKTGKCVNIPEHLCFLGCFASERILKISIGQKLDSDKLTLNVRYNSISQEIPNQLLFISKKVATVLAAAGMPLENVTVDLNTSRSKPIERILLRHHPLPGEPDLILYLNPRIQVYYNDQSSEIMHISQATAIALANIGITF